MLQGNYFFIQFDISVAYYFEGGYCLKIKQIKFKLLQKAIKIKGTHTILQKIEIRPGTKE